MDGLAAGWVAGESVASLASRFGVGITTIRNMQYAGVLPWRESQRDEEPEAPSPEDAVASESSLALSPWVQSRIAELGLQGMRDEQGATVVRTSVRRGLQTCWR